MTHVNCGEGEVKGRKGKGECEDGSGEGMEKVRGERY